MLVLFFLIISLRLLSFFWCMKCNGGVCGADVASGVNRCTIQLNSVSFFLFSNRKDKEQQQ